MNLSCYVIDDEAHAVELLSAFVERTPGLYLAGASTRPLEALAAIRQLKPAVTFADIDMPELSGLTLAGLIRKETTVIFTTSYREFGPEAFAQEAADYLLKPILYEQFLNCLERVRRKLTPVAADHFFVKTGTKGELARIDLAEVRYVSGLSAYVEIHLDDHRVITYLSLAELLEQLPTGQFLRIHKSYLVNQAYISGVVNGQVRLPGAVSLPVGRAYRAALYASLASRILISKRGAP